MKISRYKIFVEQNESEERIQALQDRLNNYNSNKSKIEDMIMKGEEVDIDEENTLLSAWASIIRDKKRVQDIEERIKDLRAKRVELNASVTRWEDSEKFREELKNIDEELKEKTKELPEIKKATEEKMQEFNDSMKEVQLEINDLK